MAESKSKQSQEQGDEDYVPEEDPRVIQAENDAEQLNKQSERAAAKDEEWAEAKQAGAPDERDDEESEKDSKSK